MSERTNNRMSSPSVCFFTRFLKTQKAPLSVCLSVQKGSKSGERCRLAALPHPSQSPDALCLPIQREACPPLISHEPPRLDGAPQVGLEPDRGRPLMCFVHSTVRRKAERALSGTAAVLCDHADGGRQQKLPHKCAVAAKAAGDTMIGRNDEPLDVPGGQLEAAGVVDGLEGRHGVLHGGHGEDGVVCVVLRVRVVVRHQLELMAV
mmetsp:Transcript_6221/g.17894  ORF Transcript_6221/g.17894 Transcript_6221/m.17894 type:complete len:206 (-) Transcript_6221:501-1118(-)